MKARHGELVRAFRHRSRLPPPIVLFELLLEPTGAFLGTADVRERGERFDGCDEGGGSLLSQEDLEPDVPSQDSE